MRETTVTLPDGTRLPLRTLSPASPTTVRGTILLAHGAGTGMDHPSLVSLQRLLAARGLVAVTFDFPYRARGAGVPDRLPVLVEAYDTVIAATRTNAPRPFVIGGRSLGGRVASHVAAKGTSVDALVFFGFPLHPPGKPGTSRATHLSAIRAPMLFVQGTRDTFARWDLLTGVVSTLPTATLHAIPDADHGFHVPKRTGRTDAHVLAEIADVVGGCLDGWR
ncbi:MAG: alpha/beta hydrolase family protein [Candidatus Binatia bacterium]